MSRTYRVPGRASVNLTEYEEGHEYNLPSTRKGIE